MASSPLGTFIMPAFSNLTASSRLALKYSRWLAKKLLERIRFVGLNGSSQCPLVDELQASAVQLVVPYGEHRQSFRGLDEFGIIKQSQRLLGSVRNVSSTNAVFTTGGIEVCEHRVQKRALPMHINAAAILSVIVIGDIFAAGELNVGVVAVRLVGLAAWTADVRVEQAGDRQGVVAHEFRFQPTWILCT